MAHMRADILSWVVRDKDKQERMLNEKKNLTNYSKQNWFTT